MGIITSPCYMSTVRSIPVEFTTEKMLSSSGELLHENSFLQDLPSNIPRYKYVGGTQFCMIMDIEFRRPEKSMIAQAQQRAAPQDKTDHSGIKDDSLLSRQIYRGDSQQPYSRRLTRSFLKSQSPNFTYVHQPSDSLGQTDNVTDGELPSDCVLFYIPRRLIQSENRWITESIT